MIIYKLAKPLRQALAVSLLAAVVGGSMLFVVQPVIGKLADLRDRIKQERTVVGRLTSAANDDGVASEALQRGAASRMRSLFVQGESEAIRIAAVQARLIEMLGAHQLKPRSARNLPVQERNNLRLVGIQLQFAAPIEKFQAILLDIEAHKPVFLIEALSVTAAPQSSAPSGDERGLLEVRLDIYGIEGGTEAQLKPQQVLEK